MNTSTISTDNVVSIGEILPAAMDRIRSRCTGEGQREHRRFESMLKAMTRSRLATLLKRHGIQRNTGEAFDFVQAKQTVFGDFRIATPGLYDKVTGWIAGYVGI